MKNDQCNLNAQDIAIVGIGCKFPGSVTDSKSFWHLLSQGHDASSLIPASRWDLEQYYDPQPGVAGKMYTQRGYFLEDVQQFDPVFFGISGREAQFIDPQQRLLLEVSYEAVESAGLSIKELQQVNTGVYIGCMNYDYAQLVATAENIDLHANTGTTPSALSGRIAHTLGLTGPVLTLDTACSSSLLCTHLACASLRTLEIDIAIVGGANLQLTPFTTVMECAGKMLAVDGRCKAFSDEADGYGRGDGCAAVILMRLQDALNLQLPIVALIKGSAVNHDGASGAMTVPNGEAQQSVIRQALKNANIRSDAINYVECHGTGTALGDPVEVDALNQVFKTNNNAKQSVWIGSVKNNIGHTEATAGLASLIKTALMLRHQTLVPHVHFNNPSKKISWQQSLVKVNTQLTAWESQQVRHAGVSSFGLSGTNVHLILGEAEMTEQKSPPKILPLCLSAKSLNALQQTVTRMLDFLQETNDADFSSVAYTSCVGREHHNFRVVIHAENRLDALNKLKEISDSVALHAHKTPIIPTECAVILSTNEKLFIDQMMFIAAYKAVISTCKNVFGFDDLSHLITFVNAYAEIEVLKSLGVKPTVYVAEGYGLFATLVANGVLPLNRIPELISAFEKGDSQALIKVLETVEFKQPQIPIVSSSTGVIFEIPNVDDCLALFYREQKAKQATELLASIALQLRITSFNWTQLIDMLVTCYYHGFNILWNKLFDVNYARKSLPTYPFEKSSYWVKQIQNSPWQFTKNILKEKSNIRHSGYLMALPNHHFAYQIDLNSEGQHYWKVHKLNGQWCLPGVMNIQAILAFKEKYFAKHTVEIQQLTFQKLVTLPSLTGVLFHATFIPDEADRFIYNSFIGVEGHWQQLATAIVVMGAEVKNHTRIINLAKVQQSWQQTVDAKTLYAGYERLGYQLGKPFQWLSQGFYSGAETLRVIAHPDETLEDESLYSLYPGLIDACMQCFDSNGFESSLHVEANKIYVPFHIKKITFEAKFDSATKAFAYALMRNHKNEYADSSIGDIALLQNDQAVIFMEGVEYRKTSMQAVKQRSEPLYQLQWELSKEKIEPRINSEIIMLQFGGHQLIKQHYYSTTICQTDAELESYLTKELTNYFSRRTEPLKFLVFFPTDSVINLPAQSLRIFIQWLFANGQTMHSIVVVSIQGQSPLNEPFDPVQSQLWGMVRVLRHEKPELDISIIDMESIHQQALADVVERMPEWQVIYRENLFYVPRLRALAEVATTPIHCHPEKVYLIFGGVGGLGSYMAKLLAYQGARKIILLSRSAETSLPEGIKQLMADGVDIVSKSLDVMDSTAVNEMLHSIVNSNSIAGIIFAVGILEDGIIESQTRQSFDSVMLPKMLGLKHILATLSQLEYKLDFFAVFSSMSAVFGTPGQSNYAAANAYIDSVCLNTKKSFPCVSIAWGPWSDVGMAARNKQKLANVFLQSGIHWIAPEQATQFFYKAMMNPNQHFIAGIFDWEKLIKSTRLTDQTTWLANFSKTALHSKAPQTQSEELYSQQSNFQQSISVRNYCQDMIAKVMGINIDQLDTEKQLNVMGLDSVMALEISSHIQQKYHLEIPLVSLLESASVDWLVSLIEQPEFSPPENLHTKILTVCIELISEIMKLPIEYIDSDRPLNTMGLDSVMALEISAAIQQRFNIEIALVELLENASLQWIANYIVESNHQTNVERQTIVEMML